jgi:hypothetical protein
MAELITRVAGNLSEAEPSSLGSQPTRGAESFTCRITASYTESDSLFQLMHREGHFRASTRVLSNPDYLRMNRQGTKKFDIVVT